MSYDEWRLEAYDEGAAEPSISVYHRQAHPDRPSTRLVLDLALAVDLRVLLGDDRVDRIVLVRCATPVAVAP